MADHILYKDPVLSFVLDVVATFVLCEHIKIFILLVQNALTILFKLDRQ